MAQSVDYTRDAWQGKPSAHDLPPPADAPARSTLVAKLAHSPLRLWPATLVCFVFSAGLAYFGAPFISDHAWNLEGTLRFTGLPLSESQRGVYTPPNPQTMGNLVNAPDNIERLRQEEHLESIPVEFLAQAFKVKVPATNEIQTLTVSLNWKDGQQGSRMVNRLMEIFIDKVAEKRKEEFARQLQDRETDVARCTANKEKADKALRKFLEDKTPVPDIKREQERLGQQLAERKREVETRRTEFKSLTAQLDASKRTVLNLRAKYGLDSGKPNQEVLRYEKEIVDTKSRLDKALSDHKENVRLNKLAVVPTIDVEKSGLEVRILEKQLKKSEEALALAIKESKEGTNIQEIAAELNNGRVIEGRLLGLKGEIEDAQKQLHTLEESLQMMNVIVEQAKPYNDQIDNASKALTAADARRSDTEALYGMSSKEFVIEVRAAPRVTAIGSDRIKMSAVLFVLPMLLGLTLITLFDVRRPAWRAEYLADRLGLPVLARIEPRASSEDGEGRLQAGARGLALRIRQYVPEPGGMVLLTPLYSGPDFDDLICDLSYYLSMRDERVLIIDTRLTDRTDVHGCRLLERLGPTRQSSNGQSLRVEPASSGLVQYLVFESVPPTDLVFPTHLRAVDLMPSGGPYPHTDALASQPMKDLLENLRSQYSLIFLVGPPIARNVDTEILAAYVQGMVLFLNSAPQDAPRAVLTETVAALKDGHAPLLGAVIYV